MGALLVCAGAAAPAGATAAPAAPESIVVGFATTSPRDQDAIADRHGAELVERLPIDGAALMDVPAGRSPSGLAAELAQDPRVAWAEPNAEVRAYVVPDDPSFGLQWGLRNTGQEIFGVAGVEGADIDAPTAWDLTTGSSAVRVAVVDTGVDVLHPDLAPNAPAVMNAGEFGGGRETNGVDDDGNGLVDDVRGWDWADDDNDPHDEDTISHGTHVSSVLAGRGGDGAGLAGVSWRASILPVRVLGAGGSGTIADVASGLDYAGERGARVVNVSLGGTVPGETMQRAIDAWPNTLYVIAAGNDGLSNDGPLPHMPCAVPSENVICVAATDQSDRLASFSNHGARTVDLAAPGVSVLGAVAGGGASFLDGTSFSAPHVAGVAALVLARHPTASTARVRDAILGSAVPLDDLDGKVATGGRLSAAGGLASLGEAGTAPAVGDASAEATGETSATLSGSVRADEHPTTYYFEWGTDTSYGSQSPVRAVAPSPPQVSEQEEIAGLRPATTYHARLVASDIDGVAVGPDVVFTTDAPPPPPPPDPAEPPGDPVTTPVEVAAPAPPTARAPSSTRAAPAAAASDAAVSVRRVGATWSLTLRLAAATTVWGRLQRRVLVPPRARRSTRSRLVSVRGLRPRDFAPGRHTVALGRLRPGAHRLTVRLRTPGRGRVITRRFRVGAPRPRLSARRSGGRVVTLLQLAGPARVNGWVEVLDGRRVATVRRRTLGGGRHAIVVARGLPARSYRVRLVVFEEHRRTVLAARVPSGP